MVANFLLRRQWGCFFPWRGLGEKISDFGAGRRL
jgi:hypothetical protein